MDVNVSIGPPSHPMVTSISPKMTNFHKTHLYLQHKTIVETRKLREEHGATQWILIFSGNIAISRRVYVCNQAIKILGFGLIKVVILVYFLVLQSTGSRRKSWLLRFNGFHNVLWLLVFCESSSRCYGLACSV